MKKVLWIIFFFNSQFGSLWTQIEILDWDEKKYFSYFDMIPQEHGANLEIDCLPFYINGDTEPIASQRFIIGEFAVRHNNIFFDPGDSETPEMYIGAYYGDSFFPANIIAVSPEPIEFNSIEGPYKISRNNYIELITMAPIPHEIYCGISEIENLQVEIPIVITLVEKNEDLYLPYSSLNYFIDSSYFFLGSEVIVDNLTVCCSWGTPAFSGLISPAENSSNIEYNRVKGNKNINSIYSSNYKSIPTKVKIYPNPFVDEIVISSTTFKSGNVLRLKILNCNGSIVVQDIFKIIDNTIKINFQRNLSPGIYFARIFDSKNKLIHDFKLVKM